jgi:hypothetical protein
VALLGLLCCVAFFKADPAPKTKGNPDDMKQVAKGVADTAAGIGVEATVNKSNKPETSKPAKPETDKPKGTTYYDSLLFDVKAAFKTEAVPIGHKVETAIYLVLIALALQIINVSGHYKHHKVIFSIIVGLILFYLLFLNNWSQQLISKLIQLHHS